MSRLSISPLLLSLVFLGSCKGTERAVPSEPDRVAPDIRIEEPTVEPVPEPALEVLPEPDVPATGANEEGLHGEWHTGTSPKGAFEVSWRLVGTESIVVNEHFELELVLTRLDGNLRIPWEKADLDVHARMPEHRHGMLTRPVPVEMGAGRYRIPAMLFHMEGYWVLRVTVDTGEGVEDIDRATFDINIK